MIPLQTRRGRLTPPSPPILAAPLDPPLEAFKEQVAMSLSALYIRLKSGEDVSPQLLALISSINSTRTEV